MKIKSAIIALACITLLPSAGFSRDLGSIFRECGIGGMIFTKTGWAAAISNIIWDLGTTATSSDITSPESCKGSGGSAARFINESYAMLAEQTAKGEGEHLHAMLNILGCQQASHSAIISGIRKDFAQEVNAPAYDAQNAQERGQAYFNILVNQAQANPAAACTIS